MIVRLLAPAEKDLEEIFDHYQSRRAGLGDKMLLEFRKGVDHIIEHPNTWQRLDETFRQFRLWRFPYGLIYHADDAAKEIVIVAITHLSRQPGWWRDRA